MYIILLAECAANVFFIRERTCEVPNHPPEIMNEFYPLLGEMILTAMLRDSDDEAGGGGWCKLDPSSTLD